MSLLRHGHASPCASSPKPAPVAADRRKEKQASDRGRYLYSLSIYVSQIHDSAKVRIFLLPANLFQINLLIDSDPEKPYASTPCFDR